MRPPYRAAANVILILALFLLPAAARAQSVITGVVRDATGGVLPGVTVEAASPVLIEKARVAVSDANGQYRIIELRPGGYTVTFTLPGFSTVRREGVELPADFTLTLDGELRVGAIEETVTVSGVSSVVDVQNTVRRQVVTREVLDLLPTGRSQSAVATLVVGITPSRPDVGGSTSMQKAFLSMHGLNIQQNTFEVDGLQSAHVDQEGSSVYYWPQAFVQEMVYQTSAIGLDATGGGVRSNMIPKDGGNTFSGSLFAAGFPQRWVAQNVDDELRLGGLSVPNRTRFLYDTELGLGGPIKQDKLWFYVNPRFYGQHSYIGGTYVCPGCYGKATAPVSDEVGLDRQLMVPIYGRLTWQMSPRNKLAGYLMWNLKYRDGQMTVGTDPLTARQHFDYDYAYVGGIKLTSTVTSKLLVEAGWAPNHIAWLIGPDNTFARGSTDWLNTRQKTDINLGTTWNSISDTRTQPLRNVFKGQVSYVPGAHSLRAGALLDMGHHQFWTEQNADLIQRYASGVPNSVVISNTPRYSKPIYRLAALYAQDTWTFGRLTANGGLRFEYLNAGYARQRADAGRFVGPRDFPETWNLPKWTTLVPRAGLVYDLFGNARTALKFAVSRYDQQYLTGFATQYNPMGGNNLTAILSWNDLNSDDLAQGELGCVYLTAGCEINFAQRPADFGVRALNTPDPDIKRPYVIETSTGVQHQLFSRVTVDVTWLRNSLKNGIVSYNTLITPDNFAPVSVVSPLDGRVFTVNNLDGSKLGQVANFDTNSGQVGRIYNIFEFNVNARLANGFTMFGGIATERTQQFDCAAPDDPNRLIFCDQREYDIPWRTQVKLNAVYSLPWQDIQVATAIQSYAPSLLPTLAGGGVAGAANWQITRTTRYAPGCLGPCTPGALVVPNMTPAQIVVPLTPGNTESLERLNQLDFSVLKTFRIGGSRLQARLDLFNTLNSNPVLTVRSSAFGTSAYRSPATILDGRTVRAGVQMSF